MNNYIPINTLDTDIENNSNQIELVESVELTETNKENNLNNMEKKNNPSFEENNIFSKINQTITYLSDNKCVKFIFGLFTLFYFTVMVFCVYIYPLSFFAKPSILRYCDDIYYKCEYYPTVGILVNNTIDKNFIDWNIKYKLYSSYQYNIGLDTKTCKDSKPHEFESFENALEVSIRSIGMSEQIFISYNDEKDCMLDYRWYDPLSFKLNVFSIIFAISFVSVSVILLVEKIIVKDNFNRFSNLIKIPVKIIGFTIIVVGGSINLLSSFMFAYYLTEYVYLHL